MHILGQSQNRRNDSWLIHILDVMQLDQILSNKKS